MVDDQDVHGKAHRAHEHEQVARGEPEAALDAQQVQRHDRQRDRDPHRQADLAFQKQAEHRHEHHVQRREKARLSGIRPGGDAGLLEVRGDGQRRAAAKAAEPELFASGAFSASVGCGRSLRTACSTAMSTSSASTAMK